MTAPASSTVRYTRTDTAVAVVVALLSPELEKNGVKVETRQPTEEKVAPEVVLPTGETVSGPATVCQYLVQTSGAHAEWLGVSDVEKAEVQQWTIYAASGLLNDLSGDQAAVDAALKSLNTHLATRTFFASTHLTLADIQIYATIYHSFAKLQRAARLNVANLTRFFDLVQHLVHELNPSPPTFPLSLIPIDLEAPPEAKPVEEKKDKKAADGKANGAATEGGKKGKGDVKSATPVAAGDKKEKKGDKKADAKPTPSDQQPSSSKSKSKSKKSAEVLLNEAPAGVEKTPEIQALESTIKEKGDLVRKLKTEGGSAEDVTKAVGELMAAKKKLTEIVAGLQK
ncbi:Eukaryotic translation elongation factor 1 epsilon-1 [Rhizophlyctis rosea]|nr:Eukaryotic translation elongation factor 1 epsilon-1 [Rhizophlyctis rosea]